jgi:ABC-2 type transport system ATP-binding protein
VADVKAREGARHVALELDGGSADGARQVLADPSLVMRLDDSHRTFEIELTPEADAGVLLRRLVDSGAAIRRFELVQPSLHQIFLDKVGAQGVEMGMTGHG